MIKSNAQTMENALTKFPNEEGLILSPRAPDEWACKYCCYSLKWKSRMSLMRLHINSLSHKRKKVELAENLTKDPNSLNFIHRGKGEGNGPKRKRDRKKKIEKIPLFKERVRVGGTRVKIERGILLFLLVFKRVQFNKIYHIYYRSISYRIIYVN